MEKEDVRAELKRLGAARRVELQAAQRLQAEILATVMEEVDAGRWSAAKVAQILRVNPSTASRMISRARRRRETAQHGG
jgi:DNA-directed RNA polymerase specialized sigma24 family protein